MLVSMKIALHHQILIRYSTWLCADRNSSYPLPPDYSSNTYPDELVYKAVNCLACSELLERLQTQDVQSLTADAPKVPVLLPKLFGLNLALLISQTTTQMRHIF